MRKGAKFAKISIAKIYIARFYPALINPHEVNEKVQHFPMIVRRKGGVVNTMVSNATARALIERSNQKHLECIDLEHSSWAKSLFQRMWLVKRTCITSKLEILEEAKKEAKLLFQHQIVSYVDQHSIPCDLFSISTKHL